MLPMCPRCYFFPRLFHSLLPTFLLLFAERGRKERKNNLNCPLSLCLVATWPSITQKQNMQLGKCGFVRHELQRKGKGEGLTDSHLMLQWMLRKRVKWRWEIVALQQIFKITINTDIKIQGKTTLHNVKTCCLPDRARERKLWRYWCAWPFVHSFIDLRARSFVPFCVKPEN